MNLTTDQVKQIEEILKGKLRARQSLEWFLYANTHDPKYEVGEYREVSDYCTRICGDPVISRKGKITEQFLIKGRHEWRYGVELIYETPKGNKSYRVVVEESDVGKVVDNNINKTGSEDTSQSMSIG